MKNLLALDLGKGSLGLAISRSGLFVTPLKEARFPAGDYSYALKAIEDVLKEETVEGFVLGLPLFPSGDDCEMTPIVKRFGKALEERYPDLPLFYQDERYSTVEAAAMLHQNGQKAKKQKKAIDSAAAMVILERFLQSQETYEEFDDEI